jgi:hypothetical protein
LRIEERTGEGGYGGFYEVALLKVADAEIELCRIGSVVEHGPTVHSFTLLVGNFFGNIAKVGESSRAP